MRDISEIKHIGILSVLVDDLKRRFPPNLSAGKRRKSMEHESSISDSSCKRRFII
jgi:hypothetical protein